MPAVNQETPHGVDELLASSVAGVAKRLTRREDEVK